MSLTVIQGGRPDHPNIPIPSATRSHTAFLEMRHDRNRLCVQRTEAGRQALNCFWNVWLRQLMLDKPDARDGVGVELRGSSVLIGSNLSRDALTAMVYGIAGLIRPLPRPPMRRHHHTSSSVEIWWNITTDDDLTECLSTLKLPQPAQLDYALRLRRGQKNPYKIGELARMVELHVALHYHDA